MAEYDLAIKQLLALEGDLASHPLDPGGLTRFGVSLKFLRDHAIDVNMDHVVNQLDVLALTPEKAAEIFRQYFWDPMRLTEVANQEVANQLLDMAANAWTTTSAKIAQQTLNTLGAQVKVDGIVGPATIAAINEQNPQSFLEAFQTQAQKFYHNLVHAHPQLAVFLKGWLRRVTV